MGYEGIDTISNSSRPIYQPGTEGKPPRPEGTQNKVGYLTYFLPKNAPTLDGFSQGVVLAPSVDQVKASLDKIRPCLPPTYPEIHR